EQYNQLVTAYQEENYQFIVSEGVKCLYQAESEFGTGTQAYAYTLKLISNACFETEDYESGIEYGKQELINMKEVVGDDHLDYASSLVTLSNNYVGNGDLDNAITIYIQAAEIFKVHHGDQSYEYAVALNEIGYYYFQKGAYEDAVGYYEQCIGIYTNLEDAGEDFVYALADLGNLHKGLGNHEEAEKALLELTDILRTIEITDLPIYAQSIYSLAQTEVILGNTTRAEIYYKETIKTFKSVYGDNSPEFNKVNNELLNFYQTTGQISKADSILRDESVMDSSDPAYAYTLMNLGARHQNNREYDRAKDAYESAEEIFRNNPGLDQERFAILLENEALLYYSTCEYQEAEQKILDAVSMYESKIGMDKPEYASALGTMGLVFRAMGYNADAELRFKESVNVYKATAGEQDPRYAAAMENLASQYLEMGRYNEAEPLLIQCADIRASSLGLKSSEYAASLNSLAACYQSMGDYNKAEAYYKQSLNIEISISGLESEQVANTMENFGRLYLDIGQYDRADSIFNKALDIDVSIFGANSAQAAKDKMNLARVYQAKGRYSEAEPLYREAIDIQKETLGERHPDYTNSLNTMAFFYQTMGNFNTAENLYNQVLGAYDRSNPDYATVLQNLSTIYLLREDYEKAEPLLVRAMKIDSVVYGVNNPNYAISLQNLAFLYQQMGKDEEAESLFKAAIEIDGRVFGTNHPSYARKLFNLAILYQDQLQFDKALPLFEESIQIRRISLGVNHPDFAYSLYGLAVLHQTMGNDHFAKPLYDEVIQIYQKQIDETFPSLSEKEKSAYYNKIGPVFEDYRDFAVEYAPTDPSVLGDLYNLQLATKALLLNSSTKVRNRILNSGDFNLIAIYNDWIGLKEQIIKYYSLTLEELDAQDIDLPAIETKANDLEKQLSSHSELFASEFEKQAVRWQDIQGQLNEESAAIEIIRIKKNIKNDSVVYAGLVITSETQDHPELVLFRNGIEMESREFKRYINLMKHSLSNNESYRVYWKPFQDYLGGKMTIYISPDGIYNKVSMNTLYNPETEGYLIDEVKLRMVSNTKELLEMNLESLSQSGGHASLLGYPDYKYIKEENQGSTITLASAESNSIEGEILRGGIKDLPGTKVEIEGVNELLKSNSWETSVYIGKDALEENIKRISNTSLLHIATHGFFLSDLQLQRKQKSDQSVNIDIASTNPLLRSGLILAGVESAFKLKTMGASIGMNEEDGILTSYEAMNLNLENTDMVVLSACETGLGEVINGEGVYGLQRSFIVAGAKSVVMSLWRVDDRATQELMLKFYQNWLAGDEKHDAFLKAQQTVRKTYDHPVYWGAFVLIGK
ncbi:tetratricopeptide repeat protein, partial [Bacteroidota bacterium]